LVIWCSCVEIPVALSVFPREKHLFPKRKAVGHRFFFFEHQPDLLGCLTARRLLYECVCVTPSFLHVTSTYWKHTSIMSPLDLPLVSVSTLLEVVLASPNFGQICSSSGNDSALSSIQAPGPTLQRLDVRLHMHSGGFSFLIPVHPTQPHRCHVFASH
jgi:hypothetical protein